MATISATPPHSPQIGGDSFDEIDIGAMPPPIHRRNGQSSISNQPAFYSLTHGFSIDEEDDGEMIDNEGKQKPKKESMELPSAESIGEINDSEKGKENDGNMSANHTNSSPPPSPYPLSAINLLPTDICDDGKCGGEEKEEDMANGKVPIELADHHPQPPSPPHTNTNQQQSPPPIYSTVYPPGIYPAPCYAAPQQNGIQSHQNVHQQQQHNVPAAYIIDSSVLNGMPAVLIRQGPNGQCAEHTMSGPVLIISDPYAELARRRRALAIITFTLLFFPTVFFLLLLYSLSYNY